MMENETKKRDAPAPAPSPKRARKVQRLIIFFQTTPPSQPSANQPSAQFRPPLFFLQDVSSVALRLSDISEIQYIGRWIDVTAIATTPDDQLSTVRSASQFCAPHRASSLEEFPGLTGRPSFSLHCHAHEGHHLCGRGAAAGLRRRGARGRPPRVP